MFKHECRILSLLEIAFTISVRTRIPFFVSLFITVVLRCAWVINKCQFGFDCCTTFLEAEKQKTIFFLRTSRSKEAGGSKRKLLAGKKSSYIFFSSTSQDHCVVSGFLSKLWAKLGITKIASLMFFDAVHFFPHFGFYAQKNCWNT